MHYRCIKKCIPKLIKKKKNELHYFYTQHSIYFANRLSNYLRNTKKCKILNHGNDWKYTYLISELTNIDYKWKPLELSN